MTAIPEAIRRLLPAWVEADPLRSRAIDALGLQLTVDRIADEFLPGLSVLTNRARYYSVLAWARKACGADEHRIHRIEVALAVREAHLHAKGDGRCRFVGSRNLAGPRFDAPPTDPHDAYHVPVWRAYRASMRDLGLLDRQNALTEEGAKLAQMFAATCRPNASGNVMLPKSACLSAIRKREGTLLEEALGIRRKGKLAEDDLSPAARRAGLERELRKQKLFDDGFSVPDVLAKYETCRNRTPSRTVSALREAAIWERLSVGLHAIFLLWLHHIRKPVAAARMIEAARRTRGTSHRSYPYEDIAIDEEAAVRAVRSIRRALALRNNLLARGQILARSDRTAFDLGEAVVSKSRPVNEVLKALEARHLQAKGDDAWVREGRRGKELARDADDKWQLPTRATLHGYRLQAFGSLLSDLRLARRNR
jgi:hypothetical protein